MRMIRLLSLGAWLVPMGLQAQAAAQPSDTAQLIAGAATFVQDSLGVSPDQTIAVFSKLINPVDRSFVASADVAERVGTISQQVSEVDDRMNFECSARGCSWSLAEDVFIAFAAPLVDGDHARVSINIQRPVTVMGQRRSFENTDYTLGFVRVKGAWQFEEVILRAYR